MTHSLHTLVRDLRLRRGRERRGLALAEGVRLVEEALAAGVPIRHLLASPALEATPRGRTLKTALVSAGHTLSPLGERDFDQLAATQHPQGILAVIEPPHWELEAIRPGALAPVLCWTGSRTPATSAASCGRPSHWAPPESSHF